MIMKIIIVAIIITEEWQNKREERKEEKVILCHIWDIINESDKERIALKISSLIDCSLKIITFNFFIDIVDNLLISKFKFLNFLI